VKLIWQHIKFNYRLLIWAIKMTNNSEDISKNQLIINKKHMKTLQIEESTARQLYKTAPSEFKKVLEDTFSKEFFSQKVTDRIKTFEDALAEIGGATENVKIMLVYNGIDKDVLGAQAMLKLSIITRALNEGWEPDWTNSNQYKYQVYLTDYKPGFGFSGSDFDYWAARTGCGSRLCFKSKELALYAGEQFRDLYNQLFLTNKN
jgi:hypothetical protein